MTLLGIDVSHHQNLNPNLVRARDEDGIQFIFIKSTEGASFVDEDFGANLGRARAAGLLVAAYHYVRSDASAQAQVANVQRVVPLDCPVIPDVEAGSGTVSLVRDVVDRLRAAGYSVPLLYLPRWYWQQLGSPPLAGLPPLWSSRYPDTVPGPIDRELAAVPDSYWNGYGGLNVAVLQFTSSASVAGYQPLDGNAYRGDRASLAALLQGDEMPLTSADTNAVWMQPCTMHYQDGTTETHPAAEWLTVIGARVSGLVGSVAGLTAAVAGLTDDETKIIAATRDIVAADSNTDLTVSPEDVQTLADAVLANLSGATRDAVREAFARAGQSDAPEAE